MYFRYASDNSVSNLPRVNAWTINRACIATHTIGEDSVTVPVAERVETEDSLGPKKRELHHAPRNSLDSEIREWGVAYRLCDCYAGACTGSRSTRVCYYADRFQRRHIFSQLERRRDHIRSLSSYRRCKGLFPDVGSELLPLI